MKDERQLQQQQQQQEPQSSPPENSLPEWKSSDPHLASILRHLRATDQRLDGKLRVICETVTECDGNCSAVEL